MMNNEIILLGAGGHCISVIEAVESVKDIKIAGILDPVEKKGTLISGYPVLGDDSLIPLLIKENLSFHITVGQIKDSSIRRKLYNNILNLNGELINIFAATSHISKNIKLGTGNSIMHNSFINAGVYIGNNCIINTGAIIEHETIIGDHCHISTNATINGQVEIGNRVFIGSGAVIFNNIKIGDDVIVGAGAVISRDLEHGTIIYGKTAG